MKRATVEARIVAMSVVVAVLLFALNVMGVVTSDTAIAVICAMTGFVLSFAGKDAIKDRRKVNAQKRCTQSFRKALSPAPAPVPIEYLEHLRGDDLRWYLDVVKDEAVVDRWVELHTTEAQRAEPRDGSKVKPKVVVKTTQGLGIGSFKESRKLPGGDYEVTKMDNSKVIVRLPKKGGTIKGDFNMVRRLYDDEPKGYDAVMERWHEDRELAEESRRADRVAGLHPGGVYDSEGVSLLNHNPLNDYVQALGDPAPTYLDSDNVHPNQSGYSAHLKAMSREIVRAFDGRTLFTLSKDEDPDSDDIIVRNAQQYLDGGN